MNGQENEANPLCVLVVLNVVRESVLVLNVVRVIDVVNVGSGDIAELFHEVRVPTLEPNLAVLPHGRTMAGKWTGKWTGLWSEWTEWTVNMCSVCA